MTSIIFFYNNTNILLQVYDTDNNFFGTINAREYCNFKLNFSSTFKKQYNLIQFGTNNSIPFWLDMNGEVTRVGTGIVFLEIGNVNQFCVNNLISINYITTNS